MPRVFVDVEVVERGTGRVVEHVDCANKNQATIDKLEGELWLKYDDAKFYTRRVVSERSRKEKRKR